MAIFAFIIAIVIVAGIMPWAFHGTNSGAFLGDIVLVIILTVILYGCMKESF